MQLDDADVGPSDAFASHCWGASFLDLVAALRHVLEPDQYVWIDIFAVLQHEHTEELKAIKQGDLDFAPVVQGCRMLILFGAHLDSVEDMAWEEVQMQKVRLVPTEERKRCAFLRVWCLVELAAALAAALPVVMLVGAADSQGKFEPNAGMLDNMYYLVDIDQAEATVASDKDKIFDEIMPQVLGASSRSECVTRINALAKGAVNGALQIMWYREVVQAAAGNMGPLRALSQKEARQALRVAASAGLLDPLRELISMGVNVNQHCRHRDIDTRFRPLSRLRENDWNVRQAILDWRIDQVGGLPLIQAATGGHTRAIEVLLHAKADPNQQLKAQGGNALEQAAVGEHKGAIEVLLRAGADPNIADAEGITALLQMAGNGNCELLQLLLDAKADLQHASLHLAAQNNKTAAIEMLVGKGLHVDVKDKEGMTPFLEAASNGHYESLQVLLRLGANLHHTTSTRTHHGSSALMLAANNGHEKAVATLLQMRADVHYADKDGDTALVVCGNRLVNEYDDQIVEAKKFAEIAALLLAANAQVDHQNKEGWTPLVEAADSGRLEVVTVLLQAKANVNHRTKKRLTPLAFAAKHEHGDVCRALLTARAVQPTRQPGCLPRHRTRRVADHSS